MAGGHKNISSEFKQTVMADGHKNISSDFKQSNTADLFNSNKINEFISSKSIAYDGKRVEWCGNYKVLHNFVKLAFDQQGKWRHSEGTSKKFEASTSDFVVTWCPGKLNTLTFKGELGCLAKEHLSS